VPTICRLIQKKRPQRGYPIIANINGSSPSLGRNRSASTLAPSTVVLLRHGESLWNKIPTFSGWCDVPLTDLGIEQARGAARSMKDNGFEFDLVYSSKLKRAYETAEAVIDVFNDTKTSKPMEPTKVWELNERHYGALQGLSKNNPELVCTYGEEQLRTWRREMMGTPPQMNEAHPHYQPPPAPLTESLHDCQVRVLKYWHGTIVPEMAKKERSILIAAHANTIRSLVAYLEDVPDDEVPHIHIPNSVPCVYKIDSNTGKALRQDISPLSKSKGNWLLSAENQERLVEKLGVDSESFARSVFAAWDKNGDGFLSKEELGNGLFSWKNDKNPAINALAGKLLEELINTDTVTNDVTLEQFQLLAVAGIRKHNLPFFEDEASS